MLSYAPGHVCLFYSGAIYHAVSRWRAKVQGEDEAITPGRISTVFFFPTESMKVLDGKGPGWGERTCFGKLPDSMIME